MKSVLITGCSDGGIGSALAVAFQARGFKVFATTRSTDKMRCLETIENIFLLPLEVTSPSSIASAVDTVKSANNGRLDYLVNNAGLFHVMPVLDTDIENAKKVFEVNFWGMLAVTQAFAPLVIAAKGCIVNIGSVSGTMHSPYLGMFYSLCPLTIQSEDMSNQH